MRSDMGKVITERGRDHAGAPHKQPKGYFRQLQSVPLDEQVKREAIRKKWRVGYGGKQFTDVLGPLRGFVRSVVGRKFSEVFSEISQVLRPAGVSGSHAQGHLWEMLITKVVIDGRGRACYADMEYRRYVWRDCKDKFVRIVGGGERGVIAFVDPRDGVIKLAPRAPREGSAAVRGDIRWVVGGRAVEPGPAFGRARTGRLLKLFGGVWYELVLVEFVTVVSRVAVAVGKHRMWRNHSDYYGFDVLFRDSVARVGFNRLAEAYGVVGVCAASKRQLGKREIRKYGLRGLA